MMGNDPIAIFSYEKLRSVRIELMKDRVRQPDAILLAGSEESRQTLRRKRILTAEKGRSGYFFTSRLDSGCLTQSFSQEGASNSPPCESLSNLHLTEEASIKRGNQLLITEVYSNASVIPRPKAVRGSAPI
jgi:hypothetical protein